MQNSSTDEKKRKAPEESQSSPPDTLVPGSDVPNKRRKVASNAISSSPSHQLLVQAANPEVSKEMRETRGEDGNEDTPKHTIDADREPTVRSKEKAKVHPPSKTARIIKLAPNRPFPKERSDTTGPRSSKKEEKNLICITRRVALGAYLRQCVELVKVDGFRTIEIHAMSAAIPHAVLLSTSLPSMLPFSASDIKTKVITGTIQCIDEILPNEDDEDDEGGMRSREKSVLRIVLTIGNGVKVGVKPCDTKGKGGRPNRSRNAKR